MRDKGLVLAFVLAVVYLVVFFLVQSWAIGYTTTGEK